MKILDAGTESLDDYDVLKFIRDKRLQMQAEKDLAKEEKRPSTRRPANFIKALQKHEEHLTNKNRPFLNNPKYDDNAQYLNKLIQTLGPRVQLTKSEYLVIVNQRPHRRSHLSAMIEDIDSRFTTEEQNFIRDAVVEILGLPLEPEDGKPNLDAQPVEIKG